MCGEPQDRPRVAAADHHQVQGQQRAEQFKRRMSQAQQAAEQARETARRAAQAADDARGRASNADRAVVEASAAVRNFVQDVIAPQQVVVVVEAEAAYSAAPNDIDLMAKQGTDRWSRHVLRRMQACDPEITSVFIGPEDFSARQRRRVRCAILRHLMVLRLGR